jgi:hypothetical protein
VGVLVGIAVILLVALVETGEVGGTPGVAADESVTQPADVAAITDNGRH